MYAGVSNRSCMTPNPHTRIEELQASIADRLKRVCYDWPLDRFEAMVRNLAFITLKYEQEMVRINYDRRR